MHHIFFPPRLQLVALQQNSDCLSAHLGNQFPFDGLFGDQADGPTGTAFRRFTADHSDNMSAAAKKGTSLAVETEPVVGLRSGLWRMQQI
jgi:hypothetical protein